MRRKITAITPIISSGTFSVAASLTMHAALAAWLLITPFSDKAASLGQTKSNYITVAIVNVQGSAAEVPTDLQQQRPKQNNKKKEHIKKTIRHDGNVGEVKKPEDKYTEQQHANLDYGAEQQIAAVDAPAHVSGDSKGQADYAAILKAWVEKHKTYPATARARREQGVVEVVFIIDGKGNLLSGSIGNSSGFMLLDNAALAAVAASSPLPAPPYGSEKLTVTVPFSFYINGIAQ